MLMHTRKGTTIVTQQEKVTNEPDNSRFSLTWESSPFQGHKYGRRKTTETSVFEFSYLCVNSSLEELIKIKVIFILRQGMFG